MTAEIAIFNKRGIAVAADSAVTLTSAKIFNSANKLFSLSKHEPIGIIVYGSADINQTPWEILIKEFRNQLKDDAFDYLEQYYDSFISFLNSSDQLKDFASQNVTTFQMVRNFLGVFLRYYNEFISLTPNKNANFDDLSFHNAYTNLKKFLNSLQNDNDFTDATIDIKNVIPNILTVTPTESQLDLLNDLFILFIKKEHRNYKFTSGIAIMGYGKKDIYPKLINFETPGKICDRIKFSWKEQTKITNELPASVYRFAQKDMTDLFFSGISQNYKDEILNIIGSRTEILMQVIEKHIPDNPELHSALKKEIYEIVKNIDSRIQSVQKENQDSIITSLSTLNKEEMINLAESLIELQALRKTVSMDSPSVGGPVDVAFISKHDGFIWIKRKLYFDKDLNHCFFKNYFKNQ